MSVSAGFADGGRLDQTASPLRYSGHGLEFTLGWAQSFAHFSVVASLQGDERRLSPLDVAQSSSEQLTEGRLTVALLRSLRSASSSTSELRAGIGVSASANVIEHTYATAESLRSEYMLAAGTVGPVVAWSHALAGGRISADAGVPLLALVDHPYSDIREQRAPLAFRFVSVSSYRELNGGLSFSSPVARSIAIVYAYRVGVVHFDDDQPVRSITQRISVGLVTKLGRAAQ